MTLNAALALSLGFAGWLVWRSKMTVDQLTSFGLYLGQRIKEWRRALRDATRRLWRC